MIYFTSDLHFGHDREFLYGPRGFKSIEEHDEEVIKRWNSVVKPEDTVYILGDLMLGDNFHGVQCIGRLAGKLKIIYGNHDTDTRKSIYKGGWLNDCKDIEVLDYAQVIKYGKFHFYISHYPTYTSNLENDAPLSQHMINLYGHTHQKSNFYQDIPFMYHVGLDSHDCYPVSVEQVLNDIRQEVAICKNLL